MKCPLRRKITEDEKGVWGTEVLDCIKGQCAWWNSELDACVTVMIALELASLGQAQDNLAREINHAVLRK